MTREFSDRATREQSRVALVGCAMFPDLYEDDHPLRDALRDRGIRVDAVRWDDDSADWAAYDLAVIRQTWDYPPRRDAFVAWAHRVPRLANPADIIEWNTDKRYLDDLAAAGVPVTPTTYLPPGTPWSPPSAGEWVIKPTVSVSSQDTGRYAFPAQSGRAVDHVARLHSAGRTAMLQPYLSAVDTAGETSVLCTPDAAGELTVSHAIRKGPLLTGPAEPRDPADYVEDISPRVPSTAERAAAAAALAAVPGGAKRLLYARVDLIPGPDGAPLLAELELTEPSLFLRWAPHAGPRLADAIVARL
ncbi:MAG TPA: hypothetical protein VFH03_01385 [Actinoplanes sp.]|nr:hypothetical protein [Actinoplanes sp.]